MKNAIAFLFFSFIFLQAQNSKIVATKINFVPTETKIFSGRDSYGYNYYINNAVFYKIKEKEHWEYKNVSLGNLTKIDINNPLKIVLFYQDFNAVILLDNQLNETQRIFFFQSENPINVIATGIAAQNQLWIYNNLNQQIGLYNYLNNTYKTISIPFPDNIQWYQTDFNHFYWVDDKNNAFVCNLFGKVSNLGKTPLFDWIEFTDNQQFIYSKEGRLFFENTLKKERFEIEILEKTFQKCYYKDQILSIFTTEGITNYKIITP
ncbi:hypothetical protein [Flavobacterium faecale]|uniref:hypothetical protein n=1 Tax=Flavobacterium faecale TaxID=1355330 RepID=UPI003AAF76DD